MRHLAIATAALALLVAGCGGDDEETRPAAETTSPTTQPAPAQTAPAENPASEEDEAAIRETLVTWLLEGPCELMSDQFLEEQSPLGDTREERCEFFSRSRVEPQYGEDDIITKDFQVNGDKASAVVADDFSNVETTFNLIRQDGRWVIDGTDL